MRKTILTVAAACLLVVTGVSAGNTTDLNEVKMTTTTLEYVEISSFCKAIVEGDYDTVKRMIELGENVNRKSLGMTPVMFAARYNQAEILELLIQHGAKLKGKSEKGFTAKRYAELSNAKEALAVIETAMRS
ncbi:MAG: ankyrin repeat domain-containing protein [Bacteroidota bacterium]